MGPETLGHDPSERRFSPDDGESRELLDKGVNDFRAELLDCVKVTDRYRVIMNWTTHPGIDVMQAVMEEISGDELERSHVLVNMLDNNPNSELESLVAREVETWYGADVPKNILDAMSRRQKRLGAS